MNPVTRHPARIARPHRASVAAGFTLMEILVASLAFAVLLSAAYVVYSGALRLRDGATARFQNLRLQDRAGAILRRDLRNALVAGGRLAATLQGQVRGPESSYPGYLKLTTASARLNDLERGADLQEVEYFITDQFETTNRNAGVLVRTVERNLLAPTRQVPAMEPLLYEVEEMEVAFYDGQQWMESWEYTQAGDPLPEAVRVRVYPAQGDTLRASRLRRQAPLEVLVPWPTHPLTATETNSNNAASGAGSETPPPQGGGGR